MIDSDNWPWLACSSNPCCAEGDMIVFFLLLLLHKMHQCDLSIRWIVDQLVGWFDWLAGWIAKLGRHEIVVVNCKMP